MYFSIILVTLYWLFTKSLVTFYKKNSDSQSNVALMFTGQGLSASLDTSQASNCWRSHFCVFTMGVGSLSRLVFYSSVLHYKRWVTRVFCTSYCRHRDIVSHPAPSLRASLKMYADFYGPISTTDVLPLAVFCSKS